MSFHNPQVHSRSQGYPLRHASCECGWKAEAAGWQDGKQRCAEHLVVIAADLVVPNLYCSCWNSASMEQDPEGPCDKCVLTEALDAVKKSLAPAARNTTGLVL